MNESSVTNLDTDTIESHSKLTRGQQVFANQILKGENATRAYLAAHPNASYNTAMVEGYKNLRKPKIQKAVRKRIAKALANAEVSDAEIIGAAARQARSSVADVLDDNGNFDIEKARKTGAIDFVKKIKTVKRVTEFEGGTAETTSTEFELMTNQDARKELANYMGIDKSSGFSPVDEMVKLMQVMQNLNLPPERAEELESDDAIPVLALPVADEESCP